jgi:hypothetical protein
MIGAAEMGQSRHFALQKSSEPFRRSATAVKATGDQPAHDFSAAPKSL